MGFFSLSHFVHQFPTTRFPLLTAIGMCHFLPVHHLGMAFLAGSKTKYNTNNRCIRLKISGYQLDLWTGWIRCNSDAHRKQVDVKQLYNQVPQTVWVSWSSSCSSRQWEPAPDRGLRPSGPLLSSPGEWGRKKCCYSQWNLGSICFSLSPSPSHLSHITNISPFENKVWEVHFSKEVCSFVIIVDYVSAYICIRIVVSWQYNT